MSIILACHNCLCGHIEIDEEVKICPVCGDEMIKIIIDDEEFCYE